MSDEILQPGQTSNDGKIHNDTDRPVNLDAGQSVRVPKRDRNQDES